MRTIKFRGKRLDNGKWIEGCFAEFVHPIDGDTKPGIQVTRCVPSSIDRFIPVYETELVEVLPESVGQWTGKFDINGVEIYKGDIVNSGHLKSDEWIPSIAVIEWDEDFAMFRQVLKGVNEGLEQLMDVPCGVIGNITDSPELMEVE